MYGASYTESIFDCDNRTRKIWLLPMPRASGVLILSRASKKLWPFIRRAAGGKSSSLTKGRCTVSCDRIPHIHRLSHLICHGNLSPRRHPFLRWWYHPRFQSVPPPFHLNRISKGGEKTEHKLAKQPPGLQLGAFEIHHPMPRRARVNFGLSV